MKLLQKIMLAPLALFAAASCSKGPGTEPADPGLPVITMTQCPEEWKSGTPVEIIAAVTIEKGSISSVKLHYNDGSPNSVAMDAAASPNEYSASFTVPSTVGKTATYYVEAVSADSKSAKSETVTLTAVENDVTTDLAGKLRLNEIGTYDTGKFIEIYNPTGFKVSLNGISLWKNGEQLIAFTSSKELPAKGYGVYSAKESRITLPAPAVDLGVTETGLSGTKSLSVELRYKGSVIDAFANTVNPGVSQMTITDWDGIPEQEATNFIRPAGSTYGWYATASIEARYSTPGKDNGSAGMRVRLKHQLFKDDAVASPPYIANVTINPANPATGLTPGDNIVQFSVYYDAHSASPAVTSSNGTPSSVEGVVWQIKPTLNGSSAGTDNAISLTAANAVAPYTEKITVLGFSAGTTFGAYSDVCLNEIRTSDKDGIELYNTSSKPVAIGGMRIRKNKDSIFIVPGYMVMKAGGYAVLGCNGNQYTGTSYLNLGSIATGLSGSKSLLIELRKPKVDGDPTNSTNVDSFVNISTTVASPNKDSAWDVDNFVEKTIPEVVGRKTDGTGAWYIFNKHSMGASNSASTTEGAAFTKTYHQEAGGE